MTLKVYFHVGPPKTGSSAIQNWMHTNQALLLKQGVYYPEHALDENGVSSGNVLNVFDRTFDKKHILSAKKIAKLIHNCSENNCDTLLLSSEFFFFRIPELLEAFPNAIFIAYIRFPLDVIESSYNQAVKRHAETKPLVLPKEPKAYHLGLLKNVLHQYGTDRFIIRYYENDILVGGDIVSDFITSLRLDIKVSPSKKVNHSYCFEALEFKRWLNDFMPADCQHRIDRLLQSYTGSNMDYSLINPKKYDEYVIWYLQQLEEFFDLFPLENCQQYLAHLRSKQQPKYIKQHMSEKSFDTIVKALVDYDYGLSQVLIKHARDSALAKTKRPDLFQIFEGYLSHNFQFTLWASQFYYSFKHRLRVLFRRLTSSKKDNIHLEVAPIENFRFTLKVSEEITDAEIFRELALLSEQNGELQLAYRLMKKADKLRPNGPVIMAKLSEYQDKLNAPFAGENPKK